MIYNGEDQCRMQNAECRIGFARCEYKELRAECKDIMNKAESRTRRHDAELRDD